MAEPTPREQALLIGGPGNGQRVQVGRDWTLIRWKPQTSEEEAAIRQDGHTGDPEMHQFVYRRSLRTRTRFVYQP
jgi:hypothetical protein